MKKKTIEETTNMDQGFEVIGKEITHKDELETISTKYIGNRSRISEDTPPTTVPLVELLQYNGLIPFREQILLGLEQDLPSRETHTRRLLIQLREIKEILPPKASPINHHKYTEDLKRHRETTSSGTSDTTTAMVKR